MVGAPFFHGQHHLLPHASHVFGHGEVAEVHAPCHKVLRQPAGECGHGVADEQHAAVGVKAAAKRHPRDVCYQGLQLLHAVLQVFFHCAAQAQVGDEADKHRVAVHLHPPHRQADRHQRAIAPHRLQFAPLHPHHVGAPALQVIGQVAVVLRAVGLGHQHGNVLAQHLRLAPAQHVLGGGVERLHAALGVDHDDGVHRRGRNGTQARLAVLRLDEQLPVAQAGIERRHQRPDHKGDCCYGQCNGHGGAALHGSDFQRRRRVNEPQGRHARVMRAGNPQAHHHACSPVQALSAPAQSLPQAKAHPQRQGGHRHRHPDRQGKAPGVVANHRCPLRSGHADVMHGTNGATEQNTAHQHVSAADFPVHQQTQCGPRSQ